MIVPLQFKIAADAWITDKQFNMIRTLADERDWSSAPGLISVTIKMVTRAEKWVPDGIVRRQAASGAIDYLLKAPKKATSTLTAAAPASTVSAWQQIKTVLHSAGVPTAKYALPWDSTDESSPPIFIEVVWRKSGGVFVNKLQGAPGTWHRVWLAAPQQLEWAKRIAKDPTKYAVLYSQKFTRCAACDSPLSNAKSIAEAMGPVCRKKFKW